ncbi:MAG: class I SAM-dependent methyltransferase [Candidatus Eremiobacteraeota bacterium]|nr:class I SAM-dependent methyltransferase [Candidatus Eremiobacteraeota bacterium]
MRDAGKMFAGAIAENYDRYLIPLLFGPYAEDLAQRLASAKSSVLETACGTGAVTRELRRVLAPDVNITSTDLNADMLRVASRNIQDARLSFAPADAQQLPFADAATMPLESIFGTGEIRAPMSAHVFSASR